MTQTLSITPPTVKEAISFSKPFVADLCFPKYSHGRSTFAGVTSATLTRSHHEEESASPPSKYRWVLVTWKSWIAWGRRDTAWRLKLYHKGDTTSAWQSRYHAIRKFNPTHMGGQMEQACMEWHWGPQPTARIHHQTEQMSLPMIPGLSLQVFQLSSELSGAKTRCSCYVLSQFLVHRIFEYNLSLSSILAWAIALSFVVLMVLYLQWFNLVIFG